VVVFSAYFQVAPSKVIIERTDSYTDINLAYRSIDTIYGRPLFFVTTQEIKDMIVSWQKSIKNVSVSRLYPSGLKIILQSYVPKFFTEMTVDDKKKNYLISENGVLIEDRAIDKTLSRLDIADPILEESILLNYKEAIPLSTMKQIIDLQTGFLKKFTDTNIAKMTYFAAEQELHVSLENGTVILFDMQSLLQNQLSLVKLYADAHPEVLQKDVLTYMDVRNQGKIFLCKERALCKKNLSRIYGKYYF